MSHIRLSVQVVLCSDRLSALRQAMSIRETIDRAILSNNRIKYIKEKVEYFPILEDYGSDGLRLKVWIDYAGKDINMFLRRMRHKSLYAAVID